MINGKIYATGGYSQLGSSRWSCTNEVRVHSLDDNNSSLVVPMKYRRLCHAGMCQDGKPSAWFEKLIIKVNKCKFVAKMNVARFHFQVVSCVTLIWAFG